MALRLVRILGGRGSPDRLPLSCPRSRAWMMPKSPLPSPRSWAPPAAWIAGRFSRTCSSTIQAIPRNYCCWGEFLLAHNAETAQEPLIAQPFHQSDEPRFSPTSGVRLFQIVAEFQPAGPSADSCNNIWVGNGHIWDSPSRGCHNRPVGSGWK